MNTPGAATLDWLCRHAAASICALFNGAAKQSSSPPADARARGASFVTLRQDGQLRGCIGTLSAALPLADDVRSNAIAAASRDPRFPPLGAAELDRTTVSVSVLSPARALACGDREELLRTLRERRDGLIVRHGPRQATFLPDVWRTIPQAAAFVDALVAKAGIDPATPFQALRFERYETRHATPINVTAHKP